MEKVHLNLMKKFIKNDDNDINKIYILEIDVEYPKHLQSNLPFLSERMKTKKYNKLLCNLFDEKEYITHIRAPKQALNHRLTLKK